MALLTSIINLICLVTGMMQLTDVNAPDNKILWFLSPLISFVGLIIIYFSNQEIEERISKYSIETVQKDLTVAYLEVTSLLLKDPTRYIEAAFANLPPKPPRLLLRTDILILSGSFMLMFIGLFALSIFSSGETSEAVILSSVVVATITAFASAGYFVQMSHLFKDRLTALVYQDGLNQLLNDEEAWKTLVKLINENRIQEIKTHNGNFPNMSFVRNWLTKIPHHEIKENFTNQILAIAQSA